MCSSVRLTHMKGDAEMPSAKVRFGVVSGVVSFLLCLLGGLWILASVGLDFENQALSTAIGIYFVGKAFFVGPMLILTALGQKKTEL